MIVVDASCLTALVAGSPADVDTAASVMAADDHWVVPGHAIIETISALRGLYLRRVLTRDAMLDAAQQLAEFRLDVWPTEPLLGRVLELADNASAYDAAYLALAEELGVPLASGDARLTRVPGVRCAVVTIAMSDSR
ncbi:type II toxin-antitoxin system VapC family toxin [Microcella sp.]|uniref:type II toxin-antitoxin system VapC family toxin n=1 Tax=Microcella sp. TaxID=1913979 RepID=UPI0039188E0E